MIVVALQTASLPLGTQVLTVRKGDAWDSEHPLVKAHPSAFSADAGDLPSSHRGETVLQRPARSSRG